MEYDGFQYGHAGQEPMKIEGTYHIESLFFRAMQGDIPPKFVGRIYGISHMLNIHWVYMEYMKPMYTRNKNGTTIDHHSSVKIISFNGLVFMGVDQQLDGLFHGNSHPKIF